MKKKDCKCKYYILFYSLSNISMDNLFKPDIVDNDKGKYIIKILKESFKKKELKVSYLGIIPYYANLFVYVTFENKPNINNLYKTFEMKDLNLDIDFVYKVIYNQAERYDKKIRDYFLTLPCNKTENKKNDNNKENDPLTVSKLKNALKINLKLLRCVKIRQ